MTESTFVRMLATVAARYRDMELPEGLVCSLSEEDAKDLARACSVQRPFVGAGLFTYRYAGVGEVVVAMDDGLERGQARFSWVERFDA